MKYQITVSEKQINTIIPALESYLRLGIGQLENVLGDLSFNQHEKFKHIAGQINNDPEVKQSLNILKRKLFNCDPNASKGICTNDVHMDFKIAYEMYQKMRQAVALQRKPEGGWSKDFDDPLKLSNEELIEVKIIEED